MKREPVGLEVEHERVRSRQAERETGEGIRVTLSLLPPASRRMELPSPETQGCEEMRHETFSSGIRIRFGAHRGVLSRNIP